MARQIEWVVVSPSAPSAPSAATAEKRVAVPVAAGRSRDTTLAAARRTAAKTEMAVRRATENKVSIEKMTTDELRERKKEGNGELIAPKMPMMLIKARAAAGAAAPLGKVAWGVKAVRADTSKFDGSGVTVAVLDTGIDADHKAFDGVGMEHENFTTEEPQDLDGHGTHCAGVIFGQDVPGHRIGIARNIQRALIYKVLGEGGGSTDKIIEAILLAKARGAHVISMSLGMDFVGYRQQLVEMDFSEAEATSIALAGYQLNSRAFDQLSQAMGGVPGIFSGSVLVAAAGNESNRPEYSIRLSPPASGEKMVSVAALGLTDTGGYRVAAFSNEGAMLAAPGEDIWSAKVDGGLVALSGTSMATPHVAGVAALWTQKLMKTGKAFSADIVINRMVGSTLALPDLDEDDVGSGLVLAPQK